jgi:hypothetical protein
MTSDMTRPVERRYHYHNAVTGLFSLLRDEGLAGLLRGIVPNTVCTAMGLFISLLNATLPSTDTSSFNERKETILLR